MPATIKDIARKAGVSHSTVSRALNERESISALTRQRIRKIAEELGYQPSAAARGLKTKRSHVIGIIVSHIDDPYFGEIVQGIEDAVHATGYRLFFASSHINPEKEKDIVRTFAELRVDGVIIASVSVSKQQADTLKQFEIPIVVINNQSPESYHCSISHDDLDGARQIARHLLNLGHRQIAYLGNHRAEKVNDDRLNGFVDEIKREGLIINPCHIINCQGGEIEDGITGMRLLLQGEKPPTAVFCFNDLVAIGALHVLHQQGIQVPEAISVAGFDNNPYAAYTFPPLTTFDQPKHAIGAEAARLLLQLIQPSGSEALKTSSHTMRGTLLIRKSTAPPCATGE